MVEKRLAARAIKRILDRQSRELVGFMNGILVSKYQCGRTRIARMLFTNSVSELDRGLQSPLDPNMIEQGHKT